MRRQGDYREAEDERVEVLYDRETNVAANYPHPHVARRHALWLSTGPA
jgi:hypothetical protein